MNGDFSPVFVAESEAFARRWRGHPAFRLLALFLECGGEELDQAIRKIHASSIPEETYRLPESAAKTAFGLLFFPLHAAATKALAWTARERADWQMETIDADYFGSYFSGIFARLPGSKRLSPRARGPIGELDITLSPYASVRGYDILRLLFYAPLMALCLESLRRECGLDVRQAYRHCVTTFTVFSGYFSRYPCCRFITFDDESNPPARVIAFRRAGGREFVVVQNGERNAHPHMAFGLMDRYLVFGPAYERILRGIGVKARFDSVGALILDGRCRALQAEMAAAGEPAYDIVFVDQGIYPHNGLCERSGRSLETIVERLAELKLRHPGLRIAYQLRAYPRMDWLEKKVRAMVELRGRNRIELLGNEDGAASYRSLARSRILMTFESTMGFEALRVGRKALFVNFSGDPAETLCSDPMFQHVDEEADYGRFETAVLRLLDAQPCGVPQFVLDRHPFADGRTQERIAALLAPNGIITSR